MNLKRRQILRGGLAAAAAALLPQPLWAAVWPQKAFESKKIADTIRSLTGGAAVSEDGRIAIKAPEIAENGAVVPVGVSADMDKVETIAILVDNNPLPLTSSYELQGASSPEVSTRIKMLKTSDVIALVKADGKYYSASKNVKVTIGGCGG